MKMTFSSSSILVFSLLSTSSVAKLRGFHGPYNNNNVLPTYSAAENQQKHRRHLGPSSKKTGPGGDDETYDEVYTTTSSDGCVCTYKKGDSDVNCVGDTCSPDDVQHLRALVVDTPPQHNRRHLSKKKSPKTAGLPVQSNTYDEVYTTTASDGCVCTYKKGDSCFGDMCGPGDVQHFRARHLGPSSEKGPKSPKTTTDVGNNAVQSNEYNQVYQTTASDGCVCTYEKGDSDVNCVGDMCGPDDVQHFRRALGPSSKKSPKTTTAPNDGNNTVQTNTVYTTTSGDGCVCTYKKGDSDVNCVGDMCGPDDVQHLRALLFAGSQE